MSFVARLIQGQRPPNTNFESATFSLGIWQKSPGAATLAVHTEKNFKGPQSATKHTWNECPMSFPTRLVQGQRPPNTYFASATFSLVISQKSPGEATLAHHTKISKVRTRLQNSHGMNVLCHSQPDLFKVKGRPTPKIPTFASATFSLMIWQKSPGAATLADHTEISKAHTRLQNSLGMNVLCHS